MKLHIDNQLIDLDCLRKISSESVIISIDQSVKSKVELAFQHIQASINKNETVYGVNTGFGKLARIRIENEDLADLQRNLVCSHAVGVGDFLPEKIVKIIMILKVVALSKGLSGVCNTVIERLCDLINHRIFPCIPAKGSVGASGDLAPLAHLSQVLIGEGEASYKGEVISAKEALQLCSLEPLK